MGAKVFDEATGSRFNILVSAGETSGDIHAAALLSRLRALLAGYAFWGMGGKALQQHGAEILVPMSQVEVMGFVEVVGAFWRIRRALKTLLAAAAERRPAAAVLTDFSGFHLRLAPRLRKLGVPVIYFISPKVWAWGAGRIKRIKQSVDLMLSILPFEEGFFRERGFERVYYAGSPLVDELADVLARSPQQAAADLGLPADSVIAVLPGSRQAEIARHAAVFAAAARRAAERIGGSVALAAALPDGQKAEQFASLAPGIKVFAGRAPLLLRAARVAVIASGTATLEAGILGAPAIVAYRANPLSMLLARALVNVRYMSLVNLILERAVYPEFVQRLDVESMADALARLWAGEARDEVPAALAELSRRLGPAGALDRAARRIAEFLRATGPKSCLPW